MHATAFNTYSDAVLKGEITDVDLGPVFDAINVKAYARTDKPELGRRVGFMARDVQKRLQQRGSPRHLQQLDPARGRQLTLGLDYSRLCCVLWSKVKQLEARLAVLEQN